MLSCRKGIEMTGLRSRKRLNGMWFLSFAVIFWCIVDSHIKNANCKARGGEPVHSIWHATKCSK
jgi:hypothetical protein